MLQMGKNDFGIHAVFKTREYYMLKIKGGEVKAKLPPDTSLVEDTNPIGPKRIKGFTKIHLVKDSDEKEIVSVMGYFQFIFGKP